MEERNSPTVCVSTFLWCRRRGIASRGSDVNEVRSGFDQREHQHQRVKVPPEELCIHGICSKHGVGVVVANSPTVVGFVHEDTQSSAACEYNATTADTLRLAARDSKSMVATVDRGSYVEATKICKKDRCVCVLCPTPLGFASNFFVFQDEALRGVRGITCGFQ